MKNEARDAAIEAAQKYWGETMQTGTAGCFARQVYDAGAAQTRLDVADEKWHPIRSVDDLPSEDDFYEFTALYSGGEREIQRRYLDKFSRAMVGEMFAPEWKGRKLIAWRRIDNEPYIEKLRGVPAREDGCDTATMKLTEFLGIDPYTDQVKCGQCENWMTTADGTWDEGEEMIKCPACVKGQEEQRDKN